MIVAKDSPISREFLVTVPQDLLDFVEKECKVDPITFVREAIVRLLENVRTNVNIQRLKGDKGVEDGSATGSDKQEGIPA